MVVSEDGFTAFQADSEELKWFNRVSSGLQVSLKDKLKTGFRRVTEEFEGVSGELQRVSCSGVTSLFTYSTIQKSVIQVPRETLQ